MVWYGMVNVDLCSAIITKVSNALDTLVSGVKPGFQTLSEGLVVLLCAEVVVEPRAVTHTVAKTRRKATKTRELTYAVSRPTAPRPVMIIKTRFWLGQL